jgi:hypothetical protein
MRCQGDALLWKRGLPASVTLRDFLTGDSSLSSSSGALVLLPMVLMRTNKKKTDMAIVYIQNNICITFVLQTDGTKKHIAHYHMT